VSIADELIAAMSDRDHMRAALETIRVEPHGHPPCADNPSLPAAPDACAVCRVIDAILPPAAVLAVPDPPVQGGGEVLTIPPDELHPFDQLADGRFVISLHAALGGRWTQMEVAYVRAECLVVEELGGERQCLWQPAWEEATLVPIPSELSVIRGAKFPGFTCTSDRRDPAECPSCTARQA